MKFYKLKHGGDNFLSCKFFTICLSKNFTILFCRKGGKLRTFYLNPKIWGTLVKDAIRNVRGTKS